MIFLSQDTYTFADYVSSVSLVAFVFVFFFALKKYFKDYEENYSRLKTSFFEPIKNEKVEKVLHLYFPYYRNLNLVLKQKFISRVEVFLDMKSFISRQCEANEQLNILIAATAVQLTFGLENFTLFSFKKILIYPDAYYNEIRTQYHKGEINTEHKLIILSANHFLDGIKTPDDGINLGLHEMAHALNFDAYLNRDSFFLKTFIQWKVVAEKEMINIKNNSNHFLRNYAATNIQEMFAVSTEYFFEKPVEFEIQLPELYLKMVILFMQNPKFEDNPLSI